MDRFQGMQAKERDRSGGWKRIKWGEVVPGLIGLAILMFLLITYLAGGVNSGGWNPFAGPGPLIP